MFFVVSKSFALSILFLFLFLRQCYSSCCVPIKIEIRTREYAEDISWETDPPSEAFFFDVYQDYSTYRYEYCLPPNTTFTFVAKDSYGDGWNGATYTVFVNETRVLGPTTFTYGFVFAEEQFATCACSCNLDCASLHRSCCVSESECGQCLPGYFSNVQGDCEKIGYISTEIISWHLFFNSTNGFGWKECNTEETYKYPCSSCHLIHCQRDGSYSIVELFLDELNLTGTIPPSISGFSNLKSLFLRGNRLTGTLPHEIVDLMNLQLLFLGDNHFIGSIPSDISNLKNLQQISLYNNELTGTIPPQIGQIKQLSMLFLNNNYLNGSIPSQIGELKNLEILQLSFNHLTGTLPNEITQLTKLKYLILNNNRISGTIPSAIVLLSDLIYLLLSNNLFSGTIPTQIGQLKFLHILFLQRNRLTGTLPPQIFLLDYLQNLALDGNQLSGTISSEINRLLQLQTLMLGENKFHGTIPSTLYSLSYLNTLSISSNEITGTISNQISKLIHLNRLYLALNKMSGLIPPEIGSLAKLQELVIYGNNFFGTLPQEIFQLQNLRILNIHSNQFDGTISHQISLLSKLQQFHAQSNQFHGSIPHQVSQLAQLQQLYLDSNQISGTIPDQIVGISQLRILSLHSNQLTGSIPKSIESLSNLERLSLNENQLTGEIPVAISTLPQVRQIYLHSNMLSGTIPPIYGLNQLEVLDISSNILSGTIPASVGLLEQLQYLDISHNNLVGSFPPEWADKFEGAYLNVNIKNGITSPFFRQLKQFRACCNQLSGHLRDFINPLLTVNSLVQLDISSNRIEGSFQFWPQKWFEYFLVNNIWYQGLSSLIIFDISSNQIQHHLPEELPTTLTIFFTGKNQLTGTIPNRYSQLFIFLSLHNHVRDNQLPSFLQVNDQWLDYDTMGVECQQFTTTDGSAKIFDIQPVYDHFARCRCKPGYYNFQSDSSLSKPFVKCEQAPPGFYTPESNKFTQAMPCPIGYFSNRHASTQCDVCTSGTFSLGGQSTCLPCPIRAQCVDGVIRLKENTWIHPKRTLNESIKNEDIYDCLNNKACVVNGSSVFCAQQLGYNSSSVLCSECLDGFYSSDRMKKICEECSGATAVISVVIGALLLFACIGLAIHQLIVVYKAEVSTGTLESNSRQITVDQECILRLVVDHIQVLIILTDLQMRGPQLFQLLVSSSVGAVVPSLSPAAIKCALNISFDTSVYIAALIPVVFIGILLTCVFCIGLILKRSFKIMLRSSFTVFVFLFYLIHPTLMRQLLQVFQFYPEKIEGEWHLLSNMDIVKSSQKYTILFLVALMGVLIYGLVAPLSAAITLRSRANVIDEKGNSLLQDSIFEQKYGFLYLGYKINDGFYLWELVIYFRKTVLLSLGVFLGNDVFLQSYLASIALIIAVVVHSKFHPYRSNRLNKIELYSLAILGITQMLMLLSSHYQISTESGNLREIITTFLLIILNSLFFVQATRIFFEGTKWKSKNICGFWKPKDKQVHPRYSFKCTEIWGSVLHQANYIVDCLEKANNGEYNDKRECLTDILSCSAKFLEELQMKCMLEFQTENLVQGEHDSNLEEEKDKEEEKSINDISAARGKVNDSSVDNFEKFEQEPSLDVERSISKESAVGNSQPKSDEEEENEKEALNFDPTSKEVTTSKLDSTIMNCKESVGSMLSLSLAARKQSIKQCIDLNCIGARIHVLWHSFDKMTIIQQATQVKKATHEAVDLSWNFFPNENG